MLVTYEDIRNDESIKCYITEADRALTHIFQGISFHKTYVNVSFSFPILQEK